MSETTKPKVDEDEIAKKRAMLKETQVVRTLLGKFTNFRETALNPSKDVKEAEKAYAELLDQLEAFETDAERSEILCQTIQSDRNEILEEVAKQKEEETKLKEELIQLEQRLKEVKATKVHQDACAALLRNFKPQSVIELRAQVTKMEEELDNLQRQAEEAELTYQLHSKRIRASTNEIYQLLSEEKTQHTSPQVQQPQTAASTSQDIVMTGQ